MHASHSASFIAVSKGSPPDTEEICLKSAAPGLWPLPVYIKQSSVRPCAQKSNKPSMKSKLTIAGLLIGSVVGFLLRPSVPLMGQLPFTTVVTRGASLRGLDQLLLGYARTSFNYLIAGMVLGALIGLIAALALERSQTPTDRRASRPS